MAHSPEFAPMAPMAWSPLPSLAQALDQLLAEMQALSLILPGSAPLRTDADRAADEAQIEAQFDDMPV